MSKGFNGKVIVIRPADISLKISEVAEKIISGIMESGELDVIGVSEAMFLSCAATNMATEIAKVYVNEICIDNLEVPILGKIATVSFYLNQTQTIDFCEAVKEEESEMERKEEQTISVGRGVKLDKLLTLCLVKFSRFDSLKVIAAGGAMNEAIILALKLISGNISKETIGVKLIHLYSIATRDDPSRKTAAISIFLRKGISTEYSKRHTELLKKMKGVY